MNTPPSPVLFIPHGGGPLPLLGDKGHQLLIDFLQNISPSLRKPSAIVIISAHWEARSATITSHPTPALIYDYSGFPAESYRIQYPAPGSPELAEKILKLLQQHGIAGQLDNTRGFDHGLFVPLKLMYPAAKIPCVQLSLLNNLDPAAHIQIGKALSTLRQQQVLFIGSGFSFHNLPAFFSADTSANSKNQSFHDWLIDCCTNSTTTEYQREKRLIAWAAEAPYARFCHPRAEHLLPLHVCYGLAGSAAKLVFDNPILGKQSCAFLW